jgi:uncharacterized protein with HEPN domain
MFEREWRFYLDDMIGFAENVVTYCQGLDLETFETTGLNYDATVRNLELIGEAASHIPSQIHLRTLATNYCNPKQTDSRIFRH